MSDRYLLLGKDRGLKNDKIVELKKRFKQANPNGEIIKYYADDKNDIKNFFSNISEASLFSSDNSFYIIENANKLTENDIKTLKKVTENSNDFIILNSDENKVSSSLSNLFEKTNTFIFYEMFENQKVPFLKAEAAKRGLKLEDSAASLLLTLRDNDTLMLRKSLDEILLFIQTENLEKNITTTLLYDFLNHDKEESGFTVASYIAKRDKKAALNAIKNMSAENSNIQSTLFPSLIFSLLRAEEVAINKENGVPQDEIFNIVDANGTNTVIRSPLEKNTIATFLKNYKRDEISRIVKLVIETEGAIRENDADLSDILLSKMILDI